MIGLNLETYKKTATKALFMTGFRPFFLLATLYASIVMLLWGAIYLYQWKMPLYNVSGMTWHAHEMIYGYSIAVVAGFLMTAVRNWTRQQTADGNLLLTLSLLWIIGRIPPISEVLSYIVASADILFLLGLFIVISRPIMKMKLSRQRPVLVILFLLLSINIAYHLSVLGLMDYSPRTLIYIALYIILTLIFIFGRRLTPNFMHSALRLSTPLLNRSYIDKYLVPLFIIFALNEVFVQHEIATFVLSVLLFILNSIRVKDWYYKEIWAIPLIWSLYLGYAFLNLGFLIKMLEWPLGISPFLGLHSFTIGGIGLLTLSMMTRVSYGHTGRNINGINKNIKWVYIGIILSVLARVMLPILFPKHQILLIEAGMILWIIAFSIFFILFAKIWITKRSDGMYG